MGCRVLMHRITAGTGTGENCPSPRLPFVDSSSGNYPRFEKRETGYMPQTKFVQQDLL